MIDFLLLHQEEEEWSGREFERRQDMPAPDHRDREPFGGIDQPQSILADGVDLGRAAGEAVLHVPYHQRDTLRIEEILEPQRNGYSFAAGAGG